MDDPGPVAAELFFAVDMITAYDPEIPFNEGSYDLFRVMLPEGSLPNPRFPAALGNRLNTHARFFDCQAGALGQPPALVARDMRCGVVSAERAASECGVVTAGHGPAAPFDFGARPEHAAKAA